MSTHYLPEFPGYDFKPATRQDMAFLPLLLYGLGNPQSDRNYELAGQSWSKHPGRRVFSFATGSEDQILAVGYNGLPHLGRNPLEKEPSGNLPKYHDDEPYYRVNPGKKLHVECAECNCCDNASHTGTFLGGAIIRLNWFPCAPCAERIIAEGISTIVAMVSPGDFAGDCRWSNTFSKSRAILAAAGIEIRIIDADTIGLPGLMQRRADLPAIPSESIDWDRRYLDLGRFMQKTWSCGEVIARGPSSNPDEPHDKIVRAVGAIPGKAPLGALEVALMNGTSVEKCTFTLPLLPSLERARMMKERGISAIKIATRLDAAADVIGRKTGLTIETKWQAPVVPLTMRRRRSQLNVVANA